MTFAVTIPARRCFKVTRRFGHRSPFRRPRPHVVEIVTYGIAVAAKDAGVLLHEYGIEASRVQLVLSGSDAELDMFMQRLDEVVAEGSAGTRNFWRRGGSYEAVPLDDDAAVIEACVDVLASARHGARPAC